MLVLTRRAGESIVIGDDVRVVVLDVRGDTVRLGIEAPRSIQVHRAEVYAEVQAANAAAAATGEDADEVAERLRRMTRPTVPRPAAPNRRQGERRAGGPGQQAVDEAAATSGATDPSTAHQPRPKPSRPVAVPRPPTPVEPPGRPAIIGPDAVRPDAVRPGPVVPRPARPQQPPAPRPGPPKPGPPRPAPRP